MSKDQEIREALKSFLEKKGFSVHLNKALKGFSGIEHVFDLVAVRGGTVLCFVLAGKGCGSILRSAVRAMDFEHANVFLLLSETHADCVPKYSSKVKGLRIVVFKDVEDLLRKVVSAISEITEPHNSPSRLA